jgi:hypothetical protein
MNITSDKVRSEDDLGGGYGIPNNINNQTFNPSTNTTTNDGVNLSKFDYMLRFSSKFGQSILDASIGFVQWTVNTTGPFISIVFVIFFDFLVLGFKQILYLIDEDNMIQGVSLVVATLLLYMIFPAIGNIIGSIIGIFCDGIRSTFSSLFMISM